MAITEIPPDPAHWRRTTWWIGVGVTVFVAVIAFGGTLLGAWVEGQAVLQATKSQEQHADAQARAATIQARTGALIGTEYQMERYAAEDASHDDDSQIQSLTVTLDSQFSSLILATTNRRMTQDVLTTVAYTEGLGVDAITSASITKLGADENLFNASVQRLEYDINPTLPSVPNSRLTPTTTATTTTK